MAPSTCFSFNKECEDKPLETIIFNLFACSVFIIPTKISLNTGP